MKEYNIDSLNNTENNNNNNNNTENNNNNINWLTSLKLKTFYIKQKLLNLLLFSISYITLLSLINFSHIIIFPLYFITSCICIIKVGIFFDFFYIYDQILDIEFPESTWIVLLLSIIKDIIFLLLKVIIISAISIICFSLCIIGLIIDLVYYLIYKGILFPIIESVKIHRFINKIINNYYYGLKIHFEQINHQKKEVVNKNKDVKNYIISNNDVNSSYNVKSSVLINSNENNNDNNILKKMENSYDSSIYFSSNYIFEELINNNLTESPSTPSIQNLIYKGNFAIYYKYYIDKNFNNVIIDIWKYRLKKIKILNIYFLRMLLEFPLPLSLKYILKYGNGEDLSIQNKMIIDYPCFT